jgi:hypothetical protein
MSNRICVPFANRLWRGESSWPGLNLVVMLVDGDYVYDVDTPVLPDLPIGISETMTGLTVNEGWAQAEPAWFPAVSDVRRIDGAVVIDVGRTEVILLIDTAVGLPTYVPGIPFWLAWQGQGIVRI